VSVLSVRDPPVAADPVVSDPTALIAEAQPRHHRRLWARPAVGVAVLGAIVAIVALATSGPPSPRPLGGSTAGTLPTGPLATLHAAGPLAVAPDGALYVTDTVGAGGEPGGNRVLLRLPDGRFRVVAGTGKTGFAGDGGPAVRAELSDVFGLAVASDGTLYIADGGRVRTVTRNGVIRTIAGNGQPARAIANGTPALSAPLGSTRSAPPLSVALSPAGQLYISTGAQILRLTAAGTQDPVRAIVTAGQGTLADRAARGRQLTGFDYIAVDAHGNIDVAGGPSGWGVWEVTPDGTAQLASGDRYAHGNGGSDPILERGPGGAIYAAAGSPGIFRVDPDRLVPIAAFNAPPSRPLHGQAFLALHFAFSPSGTLYADDTPFSLVYTDTTNAFKARQQLLSISDGRAHLLWQHTTPAPK
jgi:hypothetical protein